MMKKALLSMILAAAAVLAGDQAVTTQNAYNNPLVGVVYIPTGVPEAAAVQYVRSLALSVAAAQKIHAEAAHNVGVGTAVFIADRVSAATHYSVKFDNGLVVVAERQGQGAVVLQWGATNLKVKSVTPLAAVGADLPLVQ